MVVDEYKYKYLWKHVVSLESIAIILLDSAFRIVEYSRGFIQMFDLREPVDTYIPVYEVIPVMQLQESMNQLEKEKSTGQEVILSYLLSANNICWCRMEVVFLKEQSEYLLLFEDITEAYQAQTVLEAHSMVSEDIFLFLDPRNYALHCSEKAAHLFGFSSGRDVTGLHYSTLLQGRINLNVMEEVFIKLHEQNGYLGYVTFREEGNNHFYELSAFPVIVRDVDAGTVLVLKPLGAGTSIEEEMSERMSTVYEDAKETEQEDDYELLRETTAIYWDSRECKESLEELHRAILHYEYVEINNLLERISVLAPDEWSQTLQRIQTAVMAFDYDTALTVLEENEQDLLLV